eukprot:326445-Amphidinium_carterae.1
MDELERGEPRAAALSDITSGVGRASTQARHLRITKQCPKGGGGTSASPSSAPKAEPQPHLRNSDANSASRCM